MKKDYELDIIPFVSHDGMRTPIELFACPSDPVSGQIHLTHNGRVVATTDYLGMNGTNYRNRDGLFFLNSKLSLKDIVDGQSNTLMVGERPPSNDFWYGWWYAGAGHENSGAPDMLLGVTEVNDPPIEPGKVTYLEGCGAGPFEFQPGRREQCDTLHYWSYHPGGANFALADGSSRFFAYSNEVMEALATRNGHEVINVDF